MRKRLAFLGGAAVVVVGFLVRGPVVPGLEPPKLPDGRAIRVEVLNGSGRTKAGLGLAEELRIRGFDVVEIGNAPSRHDSTLVIDRVGEPRWAEAVAKRMRFGKTSSEPDPDRLVEVTVILGSDRADRYGRDW
jgi:hypothetical protein